jgi:hypothetical protein
LIWLRVRLPAADLPALGFHVTPRTVGVQQGRECGGGIRRSVPHALEDILEAIGKIRNDISRMMFEILSSHGVELDRESSGHRVFPVTSFGRLRIKWPGVRIPQGAPDDSILCLFDSQTSEFHLGVIFYCLQTWLAKVVYSSANRQAIPTQIDRK